MTENYDNDREEFVQSLIAEYEYKTLNDEWTAETMDDCRYLEMMIRTFGGMSIYEWMDYENELHDRKLELLGIRFSPI